VEHELGGPQVVDDLWSEGVPEVVPEVVAVVGQEVDHDAAPDVAGDEETLDIDGSLLDGIEQELADVERALAMLDEGTYGQCEVCGRAIDDEVLARTPTARYCAEHLPLSLR